MDAARTSLLPSAVTFALLAAAAAAQDTPPVTARALPPTCTKIHSGGEHEGLTYGTWCAGEHYKASFHDSVWVSGYALPR